MSRGTRYHTLDIHAFPLDVWCSWPLLYSYHLVILLSLHSLQLGVISLCSWQPILAAAWRLTSLGYTFPPSKHLTLPWDIHCISHPSLLLLALFIRHHSNPRTCKEYLYPSTTFTIFHLPAQTFRPWYICRYWSALKPRRYFRTFSQQPIFITQSATTFPLLSGLSHIVCIALATFHSSLRLRSSYTTKLINSTNVLVLAQTVSHRFTYTLLSHRQNQQEQYNHGDGQLLHT